MKTTRFFLAATAFGVIGTFSAHATELGGADLSAIDKDGDGAISAGEYQEFSDYSFEQIDTDKSGGLSASELEAHGASDFMSTMDANGDGQVSKSEMSDQMAKDFADADKDGDGKLN